MTARLDVTVLVHDDSFASEVEEANLGDSVRRYRTWTAEGGDGPSLEAMADQGSGAEDRRRAQDRTDVVGIGHLVEKHDQRRPLGQGIQELRQRWWGKRRHFESDTLVHRTRQQEIQ